ncbi:hypothetical protein PMIN01_03301 [Paraphaeosphaeria minitans]|uniref:Uncharacterized protein n=1 Tax=Paraphaeosphaeria minitans TaxID=565426 RepID=A0A9P6GMB0_9PLEO|nr:hypothetical protein PMIN01_03301 [Paraphaeosphaeria minitans]
MSSVAQVQVLKQPKAQFVNLSDIGAKSLVKLEKKQKVIESYHRLIKILETEADFIAKNGPSMVPEIDFNEARWSGGTLPPDFAKLVRERRCAILCNVVPEEQVVQIRSHPKVMKAMNCISQLRTVTNPSIPIDLTSQLTAARPKDGKTKPTGLNYAANFEGVWQEWDGWVADKCIDASSDLYHKGSSCSCWRSMQAWISLSHSNTGEGSLRLLPSLKASVAYMMLRPLFEDDEFDDTQPTFPGATPGLT